MAPQQSDAGGVGQAPPHASAWGPGERQVLGCDTEHGALKAAVVGALGSERGVMPHGPCDWGGEVGSGGPLQPHQGSDLGLQMTGPTPSHQSRQSPP